MLANFMRLAGIEMKNEVSDGEASADGTVATAVELPPTLTPHAWRRG
jgi:hypothetical protein